MHEFTRRSFLATGSALLAPAFAPAATLTGAPAPATLHPPAPGDEPVSAAFPTQDPGLAREMVLVSHGNVARVKELVSRQPSLARAAYDWGFGDWETALGAASHVGNREIAEFLIANGARPSIFSAAMLGHVDVVKAFVAAAPGVQRIHGPHGITLLAHAKAGGEAAKPVLVYLDRLGDADQKLVSLPLADEEMALLVGTYVYGTGPTERIVVDAEKGMLGFTRDGAMKRPLYNRGDRAFSPMGAPAVRIRFTVADSGAVTLAVHDPDVMMVARKV